MNAEELKTLKAAVEDKMEQRVPFPQWSHAELQYSAWFKSGQACATLIPGSGVNTGVKMVKERVQLDLEDTEEGREISKLLEEMEELDEGG